MQNVVYQNKIDKGFNVTDVNKEFCLLYEELRKVLKMIPLENVVFETDSPYLIPDGVQGKRNTFKNINTIIERFAELRGESAEYICKVALNNTKKIYPAIFCG